MNVVFASAVSSTAVKAEIVPVRHQGQTCQMSGPFKTSQLESIHALGPDMILQVSSLSDTRRSKMRLDQASAPKPELKGYLKEVRQYLDRMEAFHRTLERTRKAKDAERFIKELKKYSKVEDFAGRMSPLLRRWYLKPSGVDEIEALTEGFSAASGGDPTDSFRKVMIRLRIQYRCQFNVD